MFWISQILPPVFHQWWGYALPKQGPISNSDATVYKSLNRLTPDYIKNLFEKVSNIWTRSTRLSTINSLHIPKRNLCVIRRALNYSDATLYNTLDSSTQLFPSLNSFQHRAFKHFIYTCMLLIVFNVFKLFLSVCIWYCTFIYPSYKRALWKIRV